MGPVWVRAWFLRSDRRLRGPVQSLPASYNSKAESGIFYGDPALAIDWPIRDVQPSEKDKNAQTLAQWLASPLSDNIV